MKTPMTRRGAELLREELHRLKTIERPANSAAIGEARAHGDLSENAEYHAARERAGFIEGRISELEAKLANAQVIDPKLVDADGRCVFGATVDVEDEAGEKSTWQIVGEDEADIKKGRISVELAHGARAHRQGVRREGRRPDPRRRQALRDRRRPLRISRRRSYPQVWYPEQSRADSNGFSPDSQLSCRLARCRPMPRAERIKEEIGWLKVMFAVAVALDASLVGWLAQNDTTSTPLFIPGVVAAVVLAVVVAYVNHLAYRRLKELEDA